MDAVDDTWSGPSPSRIFAVGIALGGLVGLVVGSAIGLTLGRRSVVALRHLAEELLRRSNHVDFEVLAQ